MNKYILSFICKNEEHVVAEMLTSSLKLANAIVALDTGSEDNTINIIKEFGATHNIPTFVYESDFKDYSTARNLLKDHTIQTAKDNNFDLTKTYWFTVDCDDLMRIDDFFDPESLTEQVYKIRVITPNQITYCKNSYVRCDAECNWDGIVHEYLKTDHPIHYIETIYIEVRRSGNSWESNLVHKYMKQSLKYEVELLTNTDPRWIFYTGETYLLTQTEEGFRRAIYYFQKRIETPGGDPQEIYYSHIQLSELKKMLKYDKNEVLYHLLQAYQAEPRRAESLRFIIDHYLSTKEYHLAHIYSKISFEKHSGVPMLPEIDLYIYEDLYRYIIALEHVFICSQIGDTKGLMEAHNYLLSIKHLLPQRTEEIIDYNHTLIAPKQMHTE